MKIKKFDEKYNSPEDYENIADEYAKYIISKYLDDMYSEKTLQDTINYFIKNDDLDEYQIEQVLESIDSIINDIKNEINIISSTKKYNL